MDPTLIVFIGLAAFVAYKLFSVLGTRTGHEQRHDLEAVQASRGGDARHEPAPAPKPVKALGPVSAAAEPLRAADPDFDEKAFLEGARGAYEMVVEAFAGGDLKSIRRYLGQSVYDAFKAALVEREANGWTHELKFVGIDSAKVVSSGAENAELSAIVDFSSNQVRVTRDKDGNVVDGDPARIDLVKDRWTFSRALSSNDPNWILVATGGAG